MVCVRFLFKMVAVCGFLVVSQYSIGQSTSSYKIEKGDSLTRIAAKLLGSSSHWREIWELNTAIKDPNKLVEGQVLRIPSIQYSLGEKPKFHIVKSGESLSMLSKIYLGDASKWRQIWAVNPDLTNPNQLTAGTRIILPLPADKFQRSTIDVADSKRPSLTKPRSLDYGFAGEIESSLARGVLHQFYDRYSVAELDAYSSRADLSKIGSGSDYDRVYAKLNADTKDLSNFWGLYRTIDAYDGGFLVQQLGTAELEYSEELLLTLRLTSATGSIDSAEYLLPISVSPLIQVIPQSSQLDRPARILRTFSEESDGPVVLLDAGFSDGVKSGDILYFYKKDYVEIDSNRLVEWPTGSAGTIAVFKTWSGFSFGKVVKAEAPAGRDDKVLHY